MLCLLTNPGLVLSALQSCTEPSCILLCPEPQQTPACSGGPEHSSCSSRTAAWTLNGQGGLGGSPCAALQAQECQVYSQGGLSSVGMSSAVLLEERSPKRSFTKELESTLLTIMTVTLEEIS